MKYIITIIISVFIASTSWGKPPVVDAKNIDKLPPRVIRVCCSLGYEIPMFGLPFARINQITSIEKIGPHHYLGNGKEGDGILYTVRGGFVDMAHLRDCADWTAFMYHYIYMCKAQGITEHDFGAEGGKKVLKLHIPADIDTAEVIQLAGKIAYDLSIWHEITSGFGVKTVPMVSEEFSSFSIEDCYSNLLGVVLGMKALASDKPFNEAMTEMIAHTLDSLGVVKSLDETKAALDSVNGVWWTDKARLPSKHVTLMRHWEFVSEITPMLVPNYSYDVVPVTLHVPLITDKGRKLTDMYELSIALNNKFPETIQRVVNETDYKMMVEELERVIEN